MNWDRHENRRHSEVLPTTEPARAGELWPFFRTHWSILLVLMAATLVRVAALVAYRPGLFFSDSWSYLWMAYSEFPVAFAPDRPSGYPLLLRLLAQPHRSIATVAALQQVAGLLTGVIVYMTVRRLTVRSWIATLAAAIVLLDARGIALERHVMAEPFFTLMVLVGARLAMSERWVSAGALLGGSVLLRTAGLFALPGCVLYAAVIRRSTRTIGATLLAVAMPISAYILVRVLAGGPASITEMDGWFLYGRVAPFADCSRVRLAPEAQALCPDPAEPRQWPAYYVWDPRSPAKRLFSDQYAPGSNEFLREFAQAVIRAQPTDYLAAVARDLVGYVDVDGEGIDPTVLLPPEAEPEPLPDYAITISDRLLPGFERRVEGPATALHQYGALIRLPRPAVGVMLALMLAALALAAATGRAHVRRWPEVLFCATTALGLMIGPVLTVEFWIRFLMPALPLLCIGAGLAAEDVLSSRKGDGDGPTDHPARSQDSRPPPSSHPD